jgi:hypothetical protein
MNEAAKNSSALFTMMFNQRTNCLYRKMREIILSGGIGQVKRVNWIITDWYRTQSYYDSGDWRATWSGEGGGVLLNQCPHQLDLVQWVVGMSPKTVQAHCHFGKWHDIEVEDDVTAYFEYENGATVNTAFVTNLDEYEIRTAPDLRKAIFDADRANRAKAKKQLPKYSYPNEVLTATMVGYLSKYGIDFRVASKDCFFIRALDSQRAVGKGLFGSGYLLSEKAAAEKAAAEKAAAEKAAAEKWMLSDEEKRIIKQLGG